MKRVGFTDFVLSISVLRIKVQSMVLRFGLNPYCSSGRILYVSAHSLSLVLRIAVKSFPIEFSRVIPL